MSGTFLLSGEINIRNLSFIVNKNNKKTYINLSNLIFYVLIDKRKPTAGVGWMESIMDKNQELERGIIPAGTRIKLYEGSITLLEDTVVDANQEWIDKAIQDEKDFHSGIGRMCRNPTKD